MQRNMKILTTLYVVYFFFDFPLVVNGTPIDMRSSFASRSVFAEVWTVTCKPGTILGGYIS